MAESIKCPSCGINENVCEWRIVVGKGRCCSNCDHSPPEED